jgi:hypothetical protein
VRLRRRMALPRLATLPTPARLCGAGAGSVGGASERADGEGAEPACAGGDL